MRDVGRMGEDSFSSLCNSVGLTANRVQADKTGWDFLIEFTHQHDMSVPIDMRDGAHQCKIQVKSTDKKIQSIPMSLSNLNRLAKDPLPAFVIMLGFYDKSTIQEVHCVHLGEDMIGRVLKSIRKNEAHGKTTLNKLVMNVKFPSSSRLSRVSGESIMSFLQDSIGKSISDYTRRKLTILDNIGYTDHKHILRVNFDNCELETLENAYLGIPTTINFSEIKSYTTRFGIELEDSVDRGSGTLKIESGNGRPASLIFKENKLSPPLKFESQLYLSFLGKAKKFRIVNAFCQAFVDLESMNLKFNDLVTDSTEGTPAEVAKWFKVLGIIGKRGTLLSVEIKDGPAMGLTMKGDTGTSSEALESLEIANNLLAISQYFEVDPSFKYKVADIYKFESGVSHLSTLIKEKAECMVSFHIDLDVHPLRDPQSITCGIGCFRFYIHNLFFSLLFSLKGNTIINDEGGYELHSNRLKVHNKWVSTEAFITEDELKDYLQAGVDELGAEGHEVVIFG